VTIGYNDIVQSFFFDHKAICLCDVGGGMVGMQMNLGGKEDDLINTDSFIHSLQAFI